MPNIRRSVLFGALAALLAGAAGPTAAVTPASPSADKSLLQTAPEDRATSGSSTEPLSDKLGRSGGVIHPPNGVDPGITQAPPAIGSKSTPIIPPPGTPGSKSRITPK